MIDIHRESNRMSRTRLLAVHAGWNMAGNILPLLVAAAATPYLIHRLGIERFGLLSLIWALVGYFSLFDFGLGRSITRLVAKHQGSPEDVHAICVTGLALILAIGVVGGLITAGLAASGLADALGVTAGLNGEFTLALMAVAAGVPVTAGTAGARGVLEGLHAFRLLNLIRIPAGMLLFGVPCAVAVFSPRLDWIAACLVGLRAAILLVHLAACRRRVAWRWHAMDAAWAGRLMRFGGWLTLSNIIGPMLTYADRLVVGAAASATMLAYYAPPFEAVSRLLVLPLALTSALLPALASVAPSSHESRHLQKRALQATVLAAAVLLIAGWILAAPALRLWLGDQFAERGTLPTRVLLVGLFFQAIAQVPMTALYGHGAARPVALFNLAQLPIYPFALYVATSAGGLAGAACAWSTRMVLECAAMFWLRDMADRARPAIAKARPAESPSDSILLCARSRRTRHWNSALRGQHLTWPNAPGLTRSCPAAGATLPPQGGSR